MKKTEQEQLESFTDKIVAAVAGRIAEQQKESETEIAAFNELMKAAATINLPDRPAVKSRFDDNEYASVNLSAADYRAAENIGKIFADMIAQR